jgi:3-oxoacyl-[acyl-carrier protein] reductase
MSISSIDLNGKVALITGGTRGIGKAIAELFITSGARLLITGTKKEEIEFLNKTEKTGNVTYLYLDFTVEESLSDFINKSLPKYHVDILINNAGINKIDLNINTTDNDFDLLNEVNLKGPYILTREVSKQMKIKGYGRIVNITSIWSVVTRSGRSLYSLTKWGIIGLTKTLSIELAEDNILVNSVAPGFTKTDLTESTNSKEELRSINAQIPMKRMAEPFEIANLVAFLSSNLNSYITGQNIVIDGGYTNV